jgi:hypothetical protein
MPYRLEHETQAAFLGEGERKRRDRKRIGTCGTCIKLASSTGSDSRSMSFGRIFSSKGRIQYRLAVVPALGSCAGDGGLVVGLHGAFGSVSKSLW